MFRYSQPIMMCYWKDVYFSWTTTGRRGKSGLCVPTHTCRRCRLRMVASKARSIDIPCFADNFGAYILANLMTGCIDSPVGVGGRTS